MKFLVLALCVCAANAASVGFKPRNQAQSAKQYSQATAKAVVTAPEVVYRAEQPAAIAKAAVYNAPVAVAKTAVYADTEANAAILRSDSEVAADGYSYAFETQNGIAAQSSGTLKKVDDSEVLAIQGSYQYISPDGTPVQLSYVADENGYQPRSDLLPVGPAIPEAILRSLEYIRAHPPKPEN